MCIRDSLDTLILLDFMPSSKTEFDKLTPNIGSGKGPIIKMRLFLIDIGRNYWIGVVLIFNLL